MKPLNKIASTTLVAALILFTVGLGFARADEIITFDLTAAEPGLAAGGTGPYAQVQIDLTSSTTATITFTGLVNGGNTYLMDLVALEVNATTFEQTPMTSITATALNSGFSPNTFVFDINPTNSEDGFGKFNLEVDESGGFPASVSSISFQITDVSGSWASALDVITLNADGWNAAGHIFACLNPCMESNGAVTTGFAAGAVPEPGSLSLVVLGLGLIGLVLYERRKENWG